MQAEMAAKLHEQWGEKPCEHRFLEKEYYAGKHTGNYVCTTCGMNGWVKEGSGENTETVPIETVLQ